MLASTGKMTRRRFLTRTAQGVAVAAGLTHWRSITLRAQRRPIKVASLNDHSRVFRELTIDQTRGLELALAEVGGQVGGRTIELVRADTEANPSVGVTKAKEMIQREQVDVIIGPISSAVAAAIRDLVVESKVLWIVGTAGNIEITSEKCAPNIFRTSYDTYQVSYPFGKWVADHVTKRVVVIYPNYAFGQQMNQFFTQGFTEAGGEVVDTLAPPLGTKDFGSYLSRLLTARADAVYATQVGTDAVTLVKQFSEFGLKRRMKLLASTFTVQETFLPAQGEAALGVINPSYWAKSLDNPRNRWLVEEYRKRYDADPSVYSLHGFDAGLALVGALKATGGETGDLGALIKAMKGLDLDSPRGRLRFDPATHQVITPMYVREVKRVSGALTNVVIDDLGTVQTPPFGCSAPA